MKVGVCAILVTIVFFMALFVGGGSGIEGWDPDPDKMDQWLLDVDETRSPREFSLQRLIGRARGSRRILLAAIAAAVTLLGHGCTVDPIGYGAHEDYLLLPGLPTGETSATATTVPGGRLAQDPATAAATVLLLL